MLGLQVLMMLVKYIMEVKIVQIKIIKNIRMLLIVQMKTSLIFLRGRAPDKSQKLETGLLAMLLVSCLHQILKRLHQRGLHMTN